jgi:quinol monooxygenase YgiN
MLAQELVIFARFHAIKGKDVAIAAELRHTVARVRVEPGCLSIEAYRAVRDPRLFWLHARWTSEAAFETHAALPATKHFVQRASSITHLMLPAIERSTSFG